MAEKFVLGAVDYAILVVMLAISACIGLYFKIFGGDQKTNDDYLLAGKNMPIFPVAFSLMATFMSATTLMGLPAEIYLYGTNMILMNFGFIIGPIFASFVFLPIYFETGVSTPYEYLNKRFGRSTQRILSTIFLFQNILYNSVVLYAPAIALSAVTNLTIWTSVATVGIVCTFYCTIGGMKAVLWTDVFQCFLMFICLFTIIAIGYIELDGFGNIFNIAYEGGRIVLPTSELDFSTRYTVCSILLQGIIITGYSYCGSQIQVQRSLTTKTLKSSKIANIISAPMVSAFQLLCCLCGIICYAYFKNCDPLSTPNKTIQAADQLMPYFITTTMSLYPGLPGLCIAGIFSASLSTVSSCINSSASVTCEDVIRPVWPNLADSVTFVKCATLFYGALTIFVCFLVSYMGNLVQATLLVLGILCGPALGVFLLAAFSTVATETGANLGLLAAFVLGLCMTILTNSRKYQTLPVVKNCSNSGYNILNENVSFGETQSVNFSYSMSNMSSTFTKYEEDNLPISYMWITPLSLLTCLVIGYSYSWITTFIKGDKKEVSPTLLCPFRRKFLEKNVEIDMGQIKEQTKHVENSQL